MIFDTAAGDLDPNSFHKLAIEPLKQLCAEFPGRVGYYAKGTTSHQNNLLRTVEGLAGYGIDHRYSLSESLKSKIGNGFLQGNFDQSLLFLSRDELDKALEIYLAPIKALTSEERAGWVSGLGHGVLQYTPEENIKFMIDKIRETFHD
jgi:uroporphyrinogen decarboxylase